MAVLELVRGCGAIEFITQKLDIDVSTRSTAFVNKWLLSKYTLHPLSGERSLKCSSTPFNIMLEHGQTYFHRVLGGHGANVCGFIYMWIRADVGKVQFEDICEETRLAPGITPGLCLHAGLSWPGFYKSQAHGGIRAFKPSVVTGVHHTLAHDRKFHEEPARNNLGSVHNLSSQSGNKTRITNRNEVSSSDLPSAKSTSGFRRPHETLQNLTISYMNPLFTCLHGLHDRESDSTIGTRHRIAFFDLLSLSFGCSENADRIVPAPCDVRITGFAGTTNVAESNERRRPDSLRGIRGNKPQKLVPGDIEGGYGGRSTFNGTWKFRPSSSQSPRPRVRRGVGKAKQDGPMSIPQGRQGEEVGEEEKGSHRYGDVQSEDGQRDNMKSKDSAPDDAMMALPIMEIVPRPIFPVGNTAWTGAADHFV